MSLFFSPPTPSSFSLLPFLTPLTFSLFPLDLLALKSSPGAACLLDISNARERERTRRDLIGEKVRLLREEVARSSSDQSHCFDAARGRRRRYKGGIGRNFIDRRRRRKGKNVE